jgi:hypothetical protein
MGIGKGEIMRHRIPRGRCRTAWDGQQARAIASASTVSLDDEEAVRYRRRGPGRCDGWRMKLPDPLFSDSNTGRP